MKYFEKRRLKKYLYNLEIGGFEDGYLEYHQNKIDCLKWILASYNGCAGDPKTLLEVMLNPLTNKLDDKDVEWVKVLYYWVYYKRIVGF